MKHKKCNELKQKILLFIEWLKYRKNISYTEIANSINITTQSLEKGNFSCLKAFYLGTRWREHIEEFDDEYFN